MFYSKTFRYSFKGETFPNFSKTYNVSVIKKVNNTRPRNALLTLYKSFFRSHLDYRDIICDQPDNESFWNKPETIQCNATLFITGSIVGTTKEKLHKAKATKSFILWAVRLVGQRNGNNNTKSQGQPI